MAASAATAMSHRNLCNGRGVQITSQYHHVTNRDFE